MGAQSYWLSADDLELGGVWKYEWNNYMSSLNHRGIRLKDTSGSLLWTHNKKDGKVTASLVHDLIVKTYLVSIQNKFSSCIWLFKIPLKIKCFIWLAVENHILTWDNLIKRGWNGPSRCCLCYKSEEFVHHIFVDCSFTKRVFASLCDAYKCRCPSFGCSLLEFLEVWFTHNFKLCYIPLFACWSI